MLPFLIADTVSGRPQMAEEFQPPVLSLAVFLWCLLAVLSTPVRISATLEPGIPVLFLVPGVFSARISLCRTRNCDRPVNSESVKTHHRAGKDRLTWVGANWQARIASVRRDICRQGPNRS